MAIPLKINALPEEITKVPLDGIALPFFKESLRIGKTFAHLLLQEVALERGTISTYLPKDLDLPISKDFSHSFLRLKKQKGNYSTDSILLDLAKKFLQETPDGICIFEDVLLNPSMSTYKENPEYGVPYKEEVYRLIGQKNIDFAELEKMLKRIKQVWYFLMVMTTSSDPSIDKEGQLEEIQLSILAKKTHKIVIGAFHGEGFLIWEKNNLSPLP